MEVVYYKSVLIEVDGEKFPRTAWVVNHTPLCLPSVFTETRDNDGYLYQVDTYWLRSKKRISINDLAESFYDGKPLDDGWYHD